MDFYSDIRKFFCDTDVIKFLFQCIIMSIYSYIMKILLATLQSSNTLEVYMHVHFFWKILMGIHQNTLPVYCTCTFILILWMIVFNIAGIKILFQCIVSVIFILKDSSGTLISSKYSSSALCMSHSFWKILLWQCCHQNNLTRYCISFYSEILFEYCFHSYIYCVWVNLQYYKVLLK